MLSVGRRVSPQLEPALLPRLPRANPEGDTRERAGTERRHMLGARATEPLKRLWQSSEEQWTCSAQVTSRNRRPDTWTCCTEVLAHRDPRATRPANLTSWPAGPYRDKSQAAALTWFGSAHPATLSPWGVYKGVG
jgi:hypothetical protein